MQRKLTAALAAGLMMLSLGRAQADPSGIRYDASTHTYTNIGGSSAARSAAPGASAARSAAPTTPSATSATKASKDSDFVEYTLAPAAAAARPPSAPTQAQGSYVSAGSSGVQVVNPAPSAIVYGSSGYSAFDGGYGYGGYGYGYGGYGYGYGGYGYGYGGYGYGYGPYGYGSGYYPYGRNNLNVNSLRPISTTIFVPGQGNVTSTYIPGFGLGGLGLGNVYGFGCGYRPWIRPANVNRPVVRPR